MFNDDLKLEDQSKISKYANLMLKSNFLSYQLLNVSFQDLIIVILQLEDQKDLLIELKSGK
jgi:hypothetical protein